MATIRLTADTWLNSESEKVKGVLLVLGSGTAGKAGMDENGLKRILERRGLKYDNADLLIIRTKLVTDGVIEIV